MGVCLWQLLVPASAARVANYALAFGSAFWVLVLILSLLRPLPMNSARGTLPGAWEGRSVKG